MATTRQKAAARKNVKKARTVQSRRATGQRLARRTSGLSTQQRNKMHTETFAFPKERKEALKSGCVDRLDPAAAASRWRWSTGTGASHPLDRARRRPGPVADRILHPRRRR